MGYSRRDASASIFQASSRDPEQDLKNKSDYNTLPVSNKVVSELKRKKHISECIWNASKYSGLKKNKEEVFGPDIPRTSGGHSRGYPGLKLRSGPLKPWENKHFGVDIHDPKARTSTTLRDFQELRSDKLWAEFSFPECQ